MAHSLESVRRPVVHKIELRPSKEKSSAPENIDDIFASVWDAPLPVVTPTVDPEKKPAPTLEKQLEEIVVARQDYREFHSAAASLGSSLLSLFTSCGVACVTHGHGLLQAVPGSSLGNLSGLGEVLHDHSHDHQHDDAPQTLLQPAVSHPVVAQTPKVVPAKMTASKPLTGSIEPSDLALFFLSSRVLT